MLDWKKLGVNAVLGYGASWLYFFVMLRFFQDTFGKVKGAFLNYWVSWVVWIGVTAALLRYNPGGEKRAA